MSNNNDFNYTGAAQIFKEVQELRDKGEDSQLSEAEIDRLDNLKELQSLVMDGIGLAKELIPVLKEQFKRM